MEEYQDIENKLRTDVLVSRVEKKTWDWAIKLTNVEFSLDSLEDDRKQLKQTLFIMYGILRSNFRFMLKCYAGDLEKFRNLIELVVEDVLDTDMSSEARS